MSKCLIFTFSRRKCFGLEVRKCFIFIFPIVTVLRLLSLRTTGSLLCKIDQKFSILF